jgi:hypothetical protein
VDGRQSAWTAWLVWEFVRWHGSGTQAWYDSLGSDPAQAREVGQLFGLIGNLEVATWENGGWRRQGAIREAGPEVTKRQVQVLDLSRVAGDTVRIRLESGVSIWLIDRISIDYSADQPVTVTPALLAEARDGAGRDVRTELQAADGRYLRQESGDRAELEFSLPPQPSGQDRSFVLRSNGWYRLHTPAAGPAETELLNRLRTDPTAGSRIAVGYLNRALGRLAPPPSMPSPARSHASARSVQ